MGGVVGIFTRATMWERTQDAVPKCRGVWKRTFAVLRLTARPHWVATSGHQSKVDPAWAAWRWEQRCNYTPIVLLCSAWGETLHWRNCLLALISHWHELWQNGFPSTNPSSQPIRPNGWEQETCSSQNQLENDWVELNQWSAGRQVCYLQDEITWRDNCHARTCIYYSAGYHDQSSRNDGTLSGNSSKSIQGNAVLVWTQPNKPVCVVWPFCQAEMSEHQGKHALGTGKQPLMDRVKEVSSFQKENEMYFWRVSRSFVWGFF